MPEETENGYYVISDGDVIAKEGVNVTYYCNENYTMADHSNVTLQCFDGAFVPSLTDANIYCNPGEYRLILINLISIFFNFKSKFLS